MKVELLMPQMGESISEATIARWKKQVGDAVTKDETVLEISTDKVDSEVPSPADGVIIEIKALEGAVVPVKTVIAVIDSSAKATAKKTEVAPKAPEKKAEVPAAPKAAEVVQQEEKVSGLSPLVLQLAEKHGISSSEAEKISGSGVGGRITKEDLLNYVELKNNPKIQAAPAPKNTPAATVSRNIDFGTSDTKIIPMDAMRRAIAEHMVRSKHTSPHVYTIQECDVTKISKWRAKNKNLFKSKEGFNLSFTPFFLEAAVRALLKFPYVNSSVEGDKVILKKHVNLGCAVAIGDAEKGFGLIVPVIKHAEEKNFVGLARSLNDLALKARSKKLVPDEVSAGTFTITNPGIFGTVIGTPIINQPQAAILCLGAIRKLPVVTEDDSIAIRERCYITLSYDHRVIDGSLSGSFLAEIRNFIENWDIEQTL